MNPDDPFRDSVPLPFLALLCAEGPDAVTFLQGQLTHDLRLLADGRTLLAACCTPQGRVLALPRLRQQGESVYALLPVELVRPLAERLGRFVLRAKLRLSAADGYAVIAPGSGDVATGGAAAQVISFDYAPGRRVLALPRGHLGGPAGPPAGPVAAADVQRSWCLRDIADGLPQVVAASAEAFVPQMLNLDLLDAISFSKGCYTGQEIVARTQHLGRIKRRLFRYRLAGGPPPVTLEGLHREGARVAEVLMSAAADTGAVELLAVTSLDSRDRPLALADGRTAEPVPLPYAVP